MKLMLCIADSDFLIAHVMEDDAHYLKAMKLLDLLASQEATIIYPVTAILEAAVTIQRKYNNPSLAKALLDLFQSPKLKVLPVGESVVLKTAQLFDPRSSKHHTPFDCLVLALAKEQQAGLILSFDSYFKNKGFKLPPGFFRVILGFLYNCVFMVLSGFGTYCLEAVGG